MPKAIIMVCMGLMLSGPVWALDPTISAEQVAQAEKDFVVRCETITKQSHGYCVCVADYLRRHLSAPELVYFGEPEQITENVMAVVPAASSHCFQQEQGVYFDDVVDLGSPSHNDWQMRFL